MTAKCLLPTQPGRCGRVQFPHSIRCKHRSCRLHKQLPCTAYRTLRCVRKHRIPSTPPPQCEQCPLSCQPNRHAQGYESHSILPNSANSYTRPSGRFRTLVKYAGQQHYKQRVLFAPIGWATILPTYLSVTMSSITPCHFLGSICFEKLIPFRCLSYFHPPVLHGQIEANLLP